MSDHAWLLYDKAQLIKLVVFSPFDINVKFN